MICVLGGVKIGGMVSEPSGDELFKWAKRLWRYFRKEYPKVREVKGPFWGMLVGVAILCVVAGWLIPRAVYYVPKIRSLDYRIETSAAVIEKQKATITDQGAWLAQLRYQTQSQNNPDAIKRIEELQSEITRLHKEVTASLQFHAPEWQKHETGQWAAKGWFSVQSKFARSGLLIGVSSKNTFKSEVGSSGVLIGGEYKNSNAWTQLGSYRYYIQNPSGAYFLKVLMEEPAPIVVRHVFEGEKEGPVVTWQVP